MGPNSTVKLGYCIFLGAKNLLKANAIYSDVEKENREEIFVFYPPPFKMKTAAKMVHGIYAYVHKYMHIYAMDFPEVYLRQSEC